MRRILVALAALIFVIPGRASADPLPVPYSLLAFAESAVTATAPFDPVGGNNWNCVPSAAHPRPVVLVHGILGNGEDSWPSYSPMLYNEGYCVFAITYGVLPGSQGLMAGVGGMTPIIGSSAQLRDFVDQVRTATGAEKVDLVTWSEGTLVGAGYIQFLGGAEAVENTVNLVPIWQGTKVALPLENALHGIGAYDATFAALQPVCAGCTDMLTGSDFINRLQASGVYSDQVHYTNIATKGDLEVVPYTSGLRDAPNATNYVVQDFCPIDMVGHNGISEDRTVGALILNALAPGTVATIPCEATPFPYI